MDLEYIEQKFVQKNAIERREYQVNLANQVMNENCIVILPTGLGKTTVALLVIAKFLSNGTGGVLFLAPTRVLVNQHYEFLKNNLVLDDIGIVTGEDPIAKRKQSWMNSVICATPEITKNDLDRQIVSSSQFNLVIFDEAHRAIGDYAYSGIAERIQNSDVRILGMTATLPSEKEKATEILRTLKISSVAERDEDIEDYENCKLVLFYAEDKEEYHGFLTPEACKALDDYLLERIRDNERFTPETPVFRESYQLASLPARHLSLQLLTEIIEVTLKNIKRVRTPNGRYTVQLVHGFRKYFNLVMKDRSDSNLSLCEKLMGHSVTIPLDNNYAPFSKEKLFEEFRKAIPELTISDVGRKQTLIESQKKKITELSKKEDQIQELAKKLEEYQKRDLDDKEIVRIVEQMEKTRPELTRVIESTFTESYKKIKIAINEDMKREFGLTDKDLEELEVEKKRILKKIKEKEKLLKNP